MSRGLNTPRRQHTAAIAFLQMLNRHGWGIEISKANGEIKMIATGIDGDTGEKIVHTAICPEGNTPRQELRAALLLAEACGVQIENASGEDFFSDEPDKPEWRKPAD
jgi:hypothetical protein